MSFLIKFRYGDQNWWQNIFFLFGTEEFKANDRSLCPAVGWLLVSRRDIFKESMVSQLTMPLQWLLDSLDEDPVKEEVSTSVDFWSIVTVTSVTTAQEQIMIFKGTKTSSTMERYSHVKFVAKLLLMRLV